ncbi:MAG: sigma-70 family RNA polymerase sigma factor [Lachnospiraceae bacterium]|nr:sigma-70 family RNA polymerase sigma factor [Lachnospiraceae bacterium]
MQKGGGGVFSQRGKLNDNEDICFKAEYEAVYRYALSLCRDETEAQDITQDTFLKAMQAKNGFRGNSSVYTWLCAIAKNIWLEKMRKESRLVSMERELPERGTSLEEKITNEDTAMQIHKFLHIIEEPYKEVFTLRVFGQLSFAKIAELFGKTESWARVTYHRARKQIIEKMRKDDLL